MANGGMLAFLEKTAVINGLADKLGDMLGLLGSDKTPKAKSIPGSIIPTPTDLGRFYQHALDCHDSRSVTFRCLVVKIDGDVMLSPDLAPIKDKAPVSR
jgi:hypothetical protein